MSFVQKEVYAVAWVEELASKGAAVVPHTFRCQLDCAGKVVCPFTKNDRCGLLSFPDSSAARELQRCVHLQCAPRDSRDNRDALAVKSLQRAHVGALHEVHTVGGSLG